MDIKRAKKEIKDSIEAYLKKDAYGDYMIPAIRQRPILLMGPPGIGKTQIMEQIARSARLAWSPIPLRITPGRAPSGFRLYGKRLLAESSIP